MDTVTSHLIYKRN